MIDGWNQKKLDQSKIRIVGDNERLISLYALSSAALGIGSQRIIAPSLDKKLINIAGNLTEQLDLSHVKGYMTNPEVSNIFSESDLTVLMISYSLAEKIILNKSQGKSKVLIAHTNDEGLELFTYKPGREWAELEQIISKQSFPHKYTSDPVIDIIASGIALEETKRELMNNKSSESIITYKRPVLNDYPLNQKILVVGAGALGNMVGLGLAYSGFKDITFMDPDIAEITNLNRQILLYAGVDKNKSETLALELKSLFGIKPRAIVGYLRAKTNISKYDVVFDCVDNFESRIVMSEKCKQEKKILISGGTNIEAGQVITYVPEQKMKTPAEFLELYKIVNDRKKEYKRERASCVYRPDPSVIMTNQIIGGFMVDSYRRILSGDKPIKVFYESNSDSKIEVV